MPFKKQHKKELTSEQKKWNRMISKIRIFIEHVNRLIKRL
ncbi:MAG: transposase family protein [Lactobacillales bacterium]|nr:transposase family protein [Lactobacillales bacterium]